MEVTGEAEGPISVGAVCDYYLLLWLQYISGMPMAFVFALNRCLEFWRIVGDSLAICIHCLLCSLRNFLHNLIRGWA